MSQTGPGWLDPLLEEHGLRDDDGAVVVAFLRRAEEDRWDAVVAASDGQPLCFWSDDPSAREMAGDKAVVDGDRVLMVIVSTPPGVQPAGLIATPADANGSPLATLVAIVQANSHTMIEERGGEPQPVPAVGPRMLDSLIESAAARRRYEGFYVRPQETSRGDTVQVLLDWSGRPLRLWIEWPDEPDRRELATVIAAEDGLIVMTLDERLRPVGYPPELRPS